MKIFGFTVIIQNKNKHAFSLYQKLAGEFNLRIIRTYGASGHGKGVIDAMSNFGATNILRHNIITRDVFFNDSDSIVNYLATKKSDYSYRLFIHSRPSFGRCH